MSLEVRDLVVTYRAPGGPPVTAVDGVTLKVARGEVVALLGPSGCGKSSLLRAVAGLEPVAAGDVLWDGQSVLTVPVHRRGFGLMFQDGQLFVHRNVAGNVAYGLAGLPREVQRQRVAELLELVGLAGYGSRPITTLSGGERQRVALARSLAPSPRLLMLDEPLSALDTGLRRRLAEDLARILRETHTTAVYVTHDHQEAYTIADAVAVLSDGALLQMDAPEALRHAPASKQVAAFLGYRAFLTEHLARSLGWHGALPVGSVLGLGASSLVLDEAGVEVAVVDQGYTPDDVEIGVRLPDGQRATVSSPERIDAPTVRVRLVGGAVTPA